MALHSASILPSSTGPGATGERSPDAATSQPAVSVIIPAYNAADTLADALQSVQAQTLEDWEAIVVDDGSRDGTATIAARFADCDRRIRLVEQSHAGVSAARNTGIGLARAEWLLFLDADDWILPPLLERLTDTLANTPRLDAVHCGWVRVTADGAPLGEEFGDTSEDLFAAFAQSCVFAIHTCLVRRSLVRSVGGFDPSLCTCEDWDLWQRIARAGARFGTVAQPLSRYRLRPDSASLNGRRLLTDGLRVIARAVTPDPRVPIPHPTHAGGLPATRLRLDQLSYAVWVAALVLGHGEDAREVLEVLNDARDPGLDPQGVAERIFSTAPLATCRGPDAWRELWPRIGESVVAFLVALEEHVMRPGFAAQTRAALERMLVDDAPGRLPFTVGGTHATRVEVTEPLSDRAIPAPVERVHCRIDLEGDYLGTLELPICDGLLRGDVLADAIAARFAWSILGRFFARTVYRELAIREDRAGRSVWRGQLQLAEGMPLDQAAARRQSHDRVGWAVFLQELWGRAQWSQARFYDPQAEDAPAAVQRTANGSLTVEISEELPDVIAPCGELEIVPTIAGVALGIVRVRTETGTIRAQALRAALTDAIGVELCCSAVREALLGRPLAGPLGLRARLREGATHHGVGQPGSRWSSDGLGGSVYPSLNGLQTDAHGLLFARRPGSIGTSASRRAALPSAAATELIDAAAAAGELVIPIHLPNERPQRLVYAPDLVVGTPHPASAPAATSRGASTPPAPVRPYGRHFFESLFATQPDPWDYDNAYEQTKYEQTLAMLPRGPIDRALEVACAEGHFTVRLAARVGLLTAADISQLAIERAAARCAGRPNVRFVPLDLVAEPLPGRFDLIVCSEVLYYIGDHAALRNVARKLTDALEPGGHLVTAHVNLVVDDPEHTGYDWAYPFGAKGIGEALAGMSPLRLVEELRTPLYRIQLFQRADRRTRFPIRLHPRAPKIIELPQPTPPPAAVAAQILWRGGSPKGEGEWAADVETDHLPILLYHRVAETGASATSRYRVTPGAFEDQLRYLRDAGYYSIAIDDWRIALATRRPLPGRAVLITFDDGYADFQTHAWPLLQRYGFSATVFVVADAVGQSNRWDSAYGEEIPLLGWEEIRRLRDQGVTFGSHGATHRPLAGLCVADIVREAARSRALLARELRDPPRAFAYPYGAVDPVVEHLIGACGYVFGFSCQPTASTWHDDLLGLPRLEVVGSDTFRDFVRKFSAR